MEQHIGDPPSQASATRSPARPLDLARLRAALGLLFPPATANRLLAGGDQFAELDDLRGVVRAARQELALERLRAAIPGRRAAADRDGRDSPSLRPTRGRLALALLLALDVDASSLARLFNAPADEFGAELWRARSADMPSAPRPCLRQHAAIGQYRSLDPATRIALLTHARVCEPCRAALAAAEALDARLLEEIEREAATPPDWAPPDARLAGVRRRLAIPALALAALAMVVIATVAVDRLAAARHDPTPLVARTPDTPARGRLLAANRDGALIATDLATGAARTLCASDGDETAGYSLSPNRQRLATGAQSPLSDGQHVAIVGLDGTQARRLTWDDRGAQRRLAGWLDDDTVLMIAYAPYNPPPPQPGQPPPARPDNTLIAVDVRDGTERTLLTGAFDTVMPSPDGSMLAVVEGYDQQWPGRTLELRPYDGGRVGAALVTVEHRVIRGGNWAPDSSAFYVGAIADADIQPLPTPDASGAVEAPAIQQGALVAVRRDGTIATVYQPAARNWVVPFAIAPGGDTLIVIQESLDRQMEEASYWRLALGTGQATQLPTGAGLGIQAQPLWAPDGESLLVVVGRQHYLNPDAPLNDGGGFDGAPSAALMAQLTVFDADWQPRVLATEISTFDRQLIAWLPPDALPADAGPPPAPRGDVDAPAPVAGMNPDLTLTADSRAGADGQDVLLSDTQRAGPVVWSIADGDYRRLVTTATDLSWVGDQRLIGAMSLGDDGAGNWLALAFASRDGGSRGYTYAVRQVDPAGIRDDAQRRYARPLVSPRGNHTAYFVVNDAARTVELWLSDAGRRGAAVVTWPWPADALLTPPLTATWANDDTLIYARPDDWRDGLPRAARLESVSVTAAGDPVVQQLTTFTPRGAERGVMLTELALSPDGARLAYRLRHYARLDADGGRRDTLHVARAADVSRALELARGLPGDGLAWSPDGRWLAAGLDSRVALLSADGRRRQFVTPSGQPAAYPV